MSGRKLGVEEEFHLIDAETRRLVTRAPELLEQLPGDVYVEELQRCVVEVNSGVFPDLAALRSDLIHRRRVLVETAAEVGVGVVAAGAVPLSVPAEMAVTETPRYRRMLADYQLLAREQLICGTQVHVDVADRDEAVRIANRVAPYLPIFSRSARARRSGPTAPTPDTRMRSRHCVESVAHHRAGGAGAVRRGVRPADRRPRRQWCHQRTRDGLLRPAAVGPLLDARAAGVRQLPVGRHPSRSLQASSARSSSARPRLSTQAGSRAAGLAHTGAGGHVAGGTLGPRGRAGRRGGDRAATRATRGGRPDRFPAPPARVRRRLDVVSGLAATTLRVGSSSARQRRTLLRRGRLTDVVDLLAAETAGRVDLDAGLPDPNASRRGGRDTWTVTGTTSGGVAEHVWHMR